MQTYYKLISNSILARPNVVICLRVCVCVYLGKSPQSNNIKVCCEYYENGHKMLLDTRITQDSECITPFKPQVCCKKIY